MTNNMVRVISKNGGAVVCALDSTDIVREMERIHQPSAVVTAALGRLLTGASIMGSWLKNDEDSLTVRVDGGGPAGILLAASDGRGNVRGYAGQPIVEIPLREDGKLDVGGAVGSVGTLSVIRDLGMKEPYIGQTPLVSGEIAEDITAYYAASEQTPSVCALGVLVNADLSVRQAGGYLLQLMPGATDEEIGRIEDNIAGMPAVTDMLEKGDTPLEIARAVLAGLEPELIEERRVDYRCNCSRQRTRDILAALGGEELEEMRRENPTARVECHFCDRVYEFNLDELTQELKK